MITETTKNNIELTNSNLTCVEYDEELPKVNSEKHKQLINDVAQTTGRSKEVVTEALLHIILKLRAINGNKGGKISSSQITEILIESARSGLYADNKNAVLKKYGNNLSFEVTCQGLRLLVARIYGDQPIMTDVWTKNTITEYAKYNKNYPKSQADKPLIIDMEEPYFKATKYSFEYETNIHGILVTFYYKNTHYYEYISVHTIAEANKHAIRQGNVWTSSQRKTDAVAMLRKAAVIQFINRHLTKVRDHLSNKLLYPASESDLYAEKNMYNNVS